MLLDQQMRTGAEFKATRRDGRLLWIEGEQVEDVATHPITAGVVDALAAWYDRQHDPAWQETLLAPPGADGGRRVVAFELPRDEADLRRLSESIRTQSFLDAGNLTHTPGYGALIMLGALNVVKSYSSSPYVANAERYRDELTRTGPLLAAPFSAVTTDRFRTPDEQLAPKVVKETDAGIYVSGALGMGTGVCYADVLFYGALRPGLTQPERAIFFAYPVNAPGVRMFTRKPSITRADAFRHPLSSRYDELDCGIVLENVFVPWEDVFAYRDLDLCNQYGGLTPTWLFYFQLSRILARAEYSLGLAVATTRVQATSEIPAVKETLTDLLLYTETIRTALRAAAADFVVTPAGFAAADLMHLATGTIYAIDRRAWVAETVRNLAGSAGILAPSLGDLEDAELGPAIDASYGGGGYSALERSALLNLLSDHTASALEGREAAFQSLSTGGQLLWRQRSQLGLRNAEALANQVLATLGDHAFTLH